jgi:hypothetical protein
MTGAVLGAVGDWTEANQAYLSASMAAIRVRLERQAAAQSSVGLDEAAVVADEKVLEVRAGMAFPPALEEVVARFHLSSFERGVLLMAAAMELVPDFGRACAQARGRSGCERPSFGLAMATLPDAHWTAVLPGGALRGFNLISLDEGDLLTERSLRIDERVLHQLAGVVTVDHRLTQWVRPVGEGVDPTSFSAAHLTRLLERLQQSGPAPIQLCGPDRSALRALAVAACAHFGLPLYRCWADEVPQAQVDQSQLSRLWNREALLTGAVLLIEGGVDGAQRQAVVRWVDRLSGLVFLAGPESLPLEHDQSFRLDVPASTPMDRIEFWHSVLGRESIPLAAEVEVVATQFPLSVSQMRSVAVAVRAAPPSARAEVLWDTCRRQARRGLDHLAQRIEVRAAWTDLVLSDFQTQQLQNLVTQVRFRSQVFDQWGFGDRLRRNQGVNALFAGPSGTGKTLAAEVMAAELQLDLYRVDLSRVISKYIGETEKNLGQIFDAAEGGGAVLLFDEADALFGKRSEVKDSHDRYANIEVSYLLQRMETYRGLAILTTNLKDNLDPAFLRRLRCVVHFPFPDIEQRRELWSKAFPARTPTENLSIEHLAQLNVAGGNIANIALGAAFLAAQEGAPVRHAHIFEAAQIEYVKLKRPMTRGEMAGWT